MIGTIIKTHGTKGSVQIRLRNFKPEDIKIRDSVFVEVDGLLVPFFIEEFRAATGDSLIVKFEDIDSEPVARSYAGCDVYVSPGQVKRRAKKLSDISGIRGYRVIDKRLGYVGMAGEITGLASNPLLEIRYEGKDLLIPVHEDIILEINDRKKEVLIDAPEGLFEI